jgi:hypothetical protein
MDLERKKKSCVNKKSLSSEEAQLSSKEADIFP